jgi:hypothetical protein
MEATEREIDTDRDYLAEVDELICQMITGSGWVASVIAAQLHRKLLSDDPDLLDGWLHELAEDMLRVVISRKVRAANTAARNAASRKTFREAAQALEDADEGDREEAGRRLLSVFDAVHVVDEDNTRKKARDMTGAEHEFVAETRYALQARRLEMLSHFHRAIAEKVGDNRTEDVMDEGTYVRLYRSIVSL